MRSLTCVLSIALLIGAVSSTAQTPGPQTSFDVATIKQTKNGIISGQGAARVGWDPAGRFRIDDGSVSVLLRSAYPDVIDIKGLSGWAVTEHYDIEAKAQREPSRDERTTLLRRLLVDRFNLAADVILEERPTYALRVRRANAPLGPQLKRAPVDCTGFFKLAADAREKVPPPFSGGPRCGTMVSGSRLVSGGVTMSVLAANLGSKAGRTVVDETGLAGDYELLLEFSDDVSVFTAVREQLGLSLEPTRGMLPVLVVKRIERPSVD